MRALPLVALGLGCRAEEDDGPAPPADSTATVDSTAAPPTDAPTLSQLQEDLFTPTCAKGGCHDAATAQADLVLEAGQTWSNLVDVPSTGLPSAVRVVPGASTTSYLVLKLEGVPGIAGVQMPFGTVLDPTRITPVRSWIDAGAFDN